jgi:hypothetical protein
MKTKVWNRNYPKLRDSILNNCCNTNPWNIKKEKHVKIDSSEYYIWNYIYIYTVGCESKLSQEAKHGKYREQY